MDKLTLTLPLEYLLYRELKKHFPELDDKVYVKVAIDLTSAIGKYYFEKAVIKHKDREIEVMYKRVKNETA